jgi:hypothetical protein
MKQRILKLFRLKGSGKTELPLLNAASVYTSPKNNVLIALSI